MSQHVVVIDFPGIKEFVFATDTLREIQGASALLDAFNRDELVERIRRHLPRATAVEEVYANGGGGQLVLEAGGADEQRLDEGLVRVACDVDEVFAGGIALVYGLARLDGQGYKAAVAAAHRDLRRRRWAAPVRAAVATAPLVRECASLGARPARVCANVAGIARPEGGDDVRWVSELTRRKLAKAHEIRRPGAAHSHLWSAFEDAVGWPPCDTLDEVGELSSGRHGYIGVVYADGNSMGKVVQDIPDKESYRAFSRIVDDSVREASYEVIREHDLQALPLLLGGDDVVMVLPASAALRFAAELPEAFQRRSGRAVAKDGTPWLREKCRHGFSISVGVAVGRARHPFHLLFDQAEQLLHSAKKDAARTTGASDPRTQARVDFQIVKSSMVREVTEARKTEFVFDGPAKGNTGSFLRTLRPYEPAKLKTLLELASNLRQGKFPNSKAAALAGAAMAPTRRAAEFRAIEVLAHLKDSHRGLLEDAVDELCGGGLPPFGSGAGTFFTELYECYQLVR
ncbi:MAG: hypothetical protein HYV63_07645 [Candidatus Schekmanbacteria bacterium]|nr:hypothetical protein [Candidatus Schekmanbacteria bacterium]